MSVCCPESRFLRAAPRRVWRLRGGAKSRWRVAAGGAFSALRRAGYCVGAGPAERCGRFSCFAHAPLIKKSGQKRNHGLLWPALPSSWSVWGTRASAALRAVSVGDREKKFSFGCVGKVLGTGFGSWVCGACAVRWGFSGLLPRRAAPCSVTGTGAAGCCKVHTSEASLPAAPCAPLCGARGAAPVLRTQNSSIQCFPRACGSQGLSFGRLFFPFGD